MKINLSVQSFDSLITSGGAGLLSLCLLMRSSLFSTYRLDIKEAKEGRRGELARCTRKLPLLPSVSASLPGIRDFFLSLLFLSLFLNCSDWCLQ
jgi:hypothetical protein